LNEPPLERERERVANMVIKIEMKDGIGKKGWHGLFGF